MSDVTTANEPTIARLREESDDHSRLHDAMALIGDESRWCQGAMARTTDGVPCYYDDPAATSWCGIGALGVTHVPWYDQQLLHDVACELYRIGISGVNDYLGHAAMLACYREAIRRTEGNGDG